MTKPPEPKDGEFWYVTVADGKTGKVEVALVQGPWIWLATWSEKLPREKFRFISRCRIPACPEDCRP